jgi:hypothetical protein
MVQSALYAAERLSHAIWISHAINLVIVGEPSRTVTVLFYTFTCAFLHDLFCR